MQVPSAPESDSDSESLDVTDAEHNKKSIVDEVLDKNSTSFKDNDEVGMFLHATSRSDRGVDPLNW